MFYGTLWSRYTPTIWLYKPSIDVHSEFIGAVALSGFCNNVKAVHLGEFELANIFRGTQQWYCTP
jgi:hypothetical protein